MSTNRKLLTEIDRTLKKVDEGVEVFDEIWDKVYSASTQAQKEKYELDLKKEIKKLQRLRDQIKTWAAGNEVKDKTKLFDARKLIERKMEQFKVCERETKTKAYSREGLAKASRLDPEEKKRLKQRDWLQEKMQEIQDQVEAQEADIEALTSKRGKKDVEAIQEAEEIIRRHNWHIEQLEMVTRALDNFAIEPEEVNDLKDEVEYYIESNMDPDFYHDDQLYEQLNVASKLGKSTVTVEVPEKKKKKEKEEKSSKSKDKDSKQENSKKSKKERKKAEKKKEEEARKTAHEQLLAQQQQRQLLIQQQKQAQKAKKEQQQREREQQQKQQLEAQQRVRQVQQQQQQQQTKQQQETKQKEQKPQKPREEHPVPQKDQVRPVQTPTAKPIPEPATSVNSEAEHSRRLSLLESSLLHIPTGADSERPRAYVPQRPCAIPPSFPTTPLPAFESPEMFQKLSIDTLILSFYYQQGTYQQYLAARELKRKSWRYHKKYMTWFQRHEEPKHTTDEYEIGTYVYFDYETGWCQRLKADFTFEYPYLEDELQPALTKKI
mmetsp:Transcript_1347/g.1969  ORF Transcript_1347/g.1969 Transcript_1347/m.1969 type:complete len:548 (+) Transcript_1347:82-1725(+)